jgi:septal ring factor EnvC (AmiA/AmiB activator)
MNKPPISAFFVGRALAEGLYEQIENLTTNTLSNIGKFDAEQRENLRKFAEDVLERASREAETQIHQSDSHHSSNSSYQSQSSTDLQAMIDELRAEVAQARAELQKYRSRSL